MVIGCVNYIIFASKVLLICTCTDVIIVPVGWCILVWQIKALLRVEMAVKILMNISLWYYCYSEFHIIRCASVSDLVTAWIYFNKPFITKSEQIRHVRYGGGGGAYHWHSLRIWPIMMEKSVVLASLLYVYMHSYCENLFKFWFVGNIIIYMMYKPTICVWI